MRPRPTTNDETYACYADDGESTIPAGYTYLGQFIAHDISYLDPQAASKSRRSPALDLDSVLPEEDLSKFLSKVPGQGPLAIGSTSTNESPELPEDLPRARGDFSGKPAIADDRNDNFLPLSQCHLLLLKFYNAIARWLGVSLDPYSPEDARRVRNFWVKHFQHAVLHDYLPTIVGCETYSCVVNNGRAIVHPQRFHRGDEPHIPEERPWMPLEFATAFGRYGHSMIGIATAHGISDSAQGT